MAPIMHNRSQVSRTIYYYGASWTYPDCTSNYSRRELSYRFCNDFCYHKDQERFSFVVAVAVVVVVVTDDDDDGDEDTS